MKLASIVPMKNVELTFEGTYAMLLTHLAECYPRKHSQNCYVIMDNSLIELGSAASIENTFNAAERCNADEIILPDVFRNCEETLKSVNQSIEWLRKNNKLKRFNLMAVCQGSTPLEFIRCYNMLQDIPEIHCIGIPKVATTLGTGGRPTFEKMWEKSTKDIHLLGCWTTLDEFRRYKHPELIRSCDTCIPALLSVNGISNAWVDRPEKTIDLIRDEINIGNYRDIQLQLCEEGLL